jgi:carbonic anhydrase
MGCGEVGCGEHAKLGLRNIRDVVWLHREEILAISDPEERYRRLVEVNTVQQSFNVYKTGAVQRARLASRLEPNVPGSPFTHTLPRVHAVVYDPISGELNALKVDYKKLLADSNSVYQLYHVPGKGGVEAPTDPGSQ